MSDSPSSLTNNTSGTYQTRISYTTSDTTSDNKNLSARRNSQIASQINPFGARRPPLNLIAQSSNTSSEVTRRINKPLDALSEKSEPSSSDSHNSETNTEYSSNVSDAPMGQSLAQQMKSVKVALGNQPFAFGEAGGKLFNALELLGLVNKTQGWEYAKATARAGQAAHALLEKLDNNNPLREMVANLAQSLAAESTAILKTLDIPPPPPPPPDNLIASAMNLVSGNPIKQPPMIKALSEDGSQLSLSSSKLQEAQNAAAKFEAAVTRHRQEPNEPARQSITTEHSNTIPPNRKQTENNRLSVQSILNNEQALTQQQKETALLAEAVNELEYSLITATSLEEIEKPKEDINIKGFFIKKMSTGYKAVLRELQAFHDTLEQIKQTDSTESAQDKIRQLKNNLTTLNSTIETYLKPLGRVEKRFKGEHSRNERMERLQVQVNRTLETVERYQEQFDILMNP